MKIVSKQEFYKLPSGTLYSDYNPCIFDGLKIKGDTIGDGSPIDYFYQDLIGNVEATSDPRDIAFMLDFCCEERDGLYDNNATYAIYAKEEILALANKIMRCVGY